MSERPSSDLFISFYRGEGRDARGRTLAEIWAWDFEALECTHDYIQWLFPLPEKSRFNPNAPLVDESVIIAFQNNPHLRDNLRRSLDVMLQFYGFERVERNEGNWVVEKSKNYSLRKQDWMWPFDHNYLRITRILKCLMIFGLEVEARAFYDCLKSIDSEEGDRIGSESFHYWTEAIPP